MFSCNTLRLVTLTSPFISESSGLDCNRNSTTKLHVLSGDMVTALHEDVKWTPFVSLCVCACLIMSNNFKTLDFTT